MTVPSTQNRNDYDGNGTTAVYAYTFRIRSNTQMRAIIGDLAGLLADDVLTQGVDFTVSGAGTSGGNVTIINPAKLDGSGFLATGKHLTLVRNTALQQLLDIRNSGAYFPESVEDEFDELIFILQQQQDVLDRALSFPQSEDHSSDPLFLPSLASRINKVLAFDINGDPTALSVVPTSGVMASAFMETVLDDLTAAAARTSLGFVGAGGTVGANNLEAGAVGADKLAADAGLAKVFEGRLTLSSAVPVPTTDQLAKTSVFLTAYTGDKIALYTGSGWRLHTLTEISAGVPASTNQMYDLFVYDLGGTLFLDVVAWTNDTTRATALVKQNGVHVKTGATTRRYVGSFRTTGVSGQTEDSLAKRYLWNYYNRVKRAVKVLDATASWAVTSAAPVQARGTATNQLDMVVGVDEDAVEAFTHVNGQHNTAGLNSFTSIGLDSTSAVAAEAINGRTTCPVNNYSVDIWSRFTGHVGVGRHVLVWLEWVSSGTFTAVGSAGGFDTKSGIAGSVMG